MDYLAPRQRVAYFFESGAVPLIDSDSSVA
jgi:hypothetical protein